MYVEWDLLLGCAWKLSSLKVRSQFLDLFPCSCHVSVFYWCLKWDWNTMDSSSSTDHAKILTTISTCPNSRTHDESLFSSYIPVLSGVKRIVFRSMQSCIVIGQLSNKIEDKSQCWFYEMYKLWMLYHWSLYSFF